MKSRLISFSALVAFVLTGVSALTNLRAETPVYRKVLIIGDSITGHRPNQELGWSGHWGMAASAEEKDYVHLFLNRLAASQNGVMPQLVGIGGGGGKVPDKLAGIPQIIECKPDIAVIQLGENDRDNITRDGFQRPYEQLIEAMHQANPHVRVFCFGVWSPPSGSMVKDAMIRAACRKFGATFVDLAAANADPGNKAEAEHRFTHPGVNWHPGDKGMAAYAEALWQAFQKPSIPPAETETGAAQPRPAVTVFRDDWSRDSHMEWKPAATIETVEGKPKACIRSATASTNVIEAALPVDKIKGQYVVITTRVKAENVSAKPKSWNGIKVTLRMQNAEDRFDYPQAALPVDTFDWKDARVELMIPDNIVSATLQLGLENVSGVVWFDGVTVTAQP